MVMSGCGNALKSPGVIQNVPSVELGEEFMLKQNQGVKLQGTGFGIKILRFFDKPCPPHVDCVWSGVGIELEYSNDGQVRRGINLLKAFGYRTAIIRSDYESYAVLMIMRD
jgi:hypothetical protein